MNVDLKSMHRLLQYVAIFILFPAAIALHQSLMQLALYLAQQQSSGVSL